MTHRGGERIARSPDGRPYSRQLMPCRQVRPVNVHVQSVSVCRLCIKVAVCEWCGDSAGAVWERCGDGVVTVWGRCGDGVGTVW